MATLMLVDDTDDIRTMLRFQLQKLGHRVVEASGAEEAVEVAMRESPNLVVMDIELPEIDGISATYVLREHEELRHVPVIAVTAHDGEDYRTDAAEAGCAGFITKPIDFNKLGSLIDTLLASG